MAKRGNGEGTVWKDETRNRWEGQIRLDGQRRKAVGKTKSDVIGKLAALRSAFESGTLEPPTSAPVPTALTVGELAARWTDRVLNARHMAPSTEQRYRWALQMIDAELGEHAVDDVTVDMIEDALDAIATGKHGRGEPLARTSMVRVRDLLVTLFDYAMRRKQATSNPAQLAELKRGDSRRRPATSLTVDEARKLWAGVENERFGLLYRLQMATGMRPGEAAAVCWDAIDLDKATLNVRRGVRLDQRGRATLVDSLKTSGSFRTVKLAPALVAELRDYRRANASDVVDLHAPRLLFVSTVGGPVAPTHVRDELARICRQLGLREVRPNELRHSAASLMSDRGVALEQIADQLGHASTRMLDKTYRHRLRPTVDAGAEVLGALFDA